MNEDKINELNKIRERFAGDLFATECADCTIAEVDERRAVCTMKICRKHKNAMGGVMGGAVFTLCDFTFAVAANGLDKPYAMTLSTSVTYLSQPRGDMLYAEALCRKDGKRTCFYEITVTDNVGTVVAVAVFNGYKLDASPSKQSSSDGTK